MNKGIIIAGGIILFVSGGLFVANQQSQKVEEAKIMQEKVATKEREDTTMTDKNPSRYVVYSKAAYEAGASRRRILYFYATWCPSCKQANGDFTANPNKIPEDMVVLRVNYNDPDTDQEEKDLAKKYSITYQHTFVQIDNQGKEITKWNGGQTDELLAKIK